MPKFFAGPKTPSIARPFPLLSLRLEVGLLNRLQLKGLGEHCRLPQRVWGGNQIWCILALKSDIWWHQLC